MLPMAIPLGDITPSGAWKNSCSIFPLFSAQLLSSWRLRIFWWQINKSLTSKYISILEKISCIYPRNWRRITSILSFKDKLFVTVLLGVIFIALGTWLWFIYTSVTVAIPKTGGEYTEGIIGQPLYINPLLSQTSEADSDLTQLVYSGLFKYDKEGKTVPDLAESFSVSEDQKTYTVKMRSGLKWQDGNDLTAADALFTMTILQDQAYKSPIRQNWQGVEISMADENSLQFALKNPYSGFLDNLTVGILPKHIWENILPEKFALAEYNLHPIGSGPYAFASLQKDAGGNILSFKLIANKYYYEKLPYISRMSFNFYPDEESMLAAYNKKEAMGISNIEPEKVVELKNGKSTQVHELAIPRYFALFLNQTKNPALANDSVRKALNMAVNKDEIVKEVLKGKGSVLTSPFLPQMKEFEAGLDGGFDLEGAKKLLEENDWKYTDDSKTIRKKGNQELKFEIVTADWVELSQTAEILKKQWEQIGASVSVKVLAVSDLQQNYIRTREYDSLLFGQVISFNPDLYSFWHSSQKRDPGLNLAVFENADIDKLLEEVRQEPNEQVRIEKYKQLQKEFAKTENSPAIFLYSPYYLYPTSNVLKGMDVKNINNPAQRFLNVNEWFVKTSRKFK